jgi:hypothetical protein
MVAVVVVPIRAERERHDAEAEARTIVGDQHHPAVIVVFEEAGGDPAALAERDHVAPGPVLEAADHFDRLTRGDVQHARIAPVGTGAHVDAAGGVGHVVGERQRGGRAERETDNGGR